VVFGQTFVDGNANGRFDLGDAVLPGMNVTLVGTTYLGTQINATTTSDVNGAFQFNNVPAGNYRVLFPSVPGFQAEAGGALKIHEAPGLGLPLTLGYLGLPSQAITLRQFLTTATPGTSLVPQAGHAQVNATGPKLVSQIVNGSALTMSSTGSSATQLFDLSGNFAAPDTTDTLVRFDTSAGPINVVLFDTLAPRTVTNFLNYINSGKYNNSIFHRETLLGKDGLAVLQGGANQLNTATAGATTLPTIPTDPAVANEVNLPNVPYTLSMAMTSAPNTATSQFFFNLSDNSNVLSPSGTGGAASGGFTVFAQLAGPADKAVLSALSGLPITAQTGFPSIPLKGHLNNDPSFPGDSVASNYALIKDAVVISKNDRLTYSVVSSNPSVVTAALGTLGNATTAGGGNERLTLTGKRSGTATIVVTATDIFGSTTVSAFTVTIPNTPPVVSVPTLTPAAPTPTSMVTATVTTPTDANGDPVTLTYTWQIFDGTKFTTVQGPTKKVSTQTDFLTDTLDLSMVTKVTVKAGDQVQVTVTPNDGLVNGTPESAIVTIVAPTTGG
jgi:cyclophilin family peptidyl-prolyl cis-trans isomerase